MNTILAESPALPEGDPPSIVSVNSRGGSSSDLAAKLAFGLLVAGLLVIGGLVGINKYRAAHKLDEQAEAQAAKTASAPAATTKRRTFDTDPPAPPAASATPSPAFTPTCQDGSAARPLIGPDGQALTAPSGQPMRVCQNGQLMVPAIQPLPDDRQLPTGAPQGGLATPPAPTATISRYGGDVMLPQSAATLPAAQQVDPMVRHAPSVLAQGQDAGAGDVQHWTAPVAAPTAGAGARDESSQQGAMEPLLTGSSSQRVTASMIGDRDMVIPQGRSIDCNLSMKLVNEVSGKATCVLSSNVYSDSGRVVLAERGSTATGEYIATMAQGQRRLFVLWTRLQTPTGVIIDLNSPAADALGTSGLPGDIDNRWRDRIGAAILLSLVEDAIAYQTAKASSGDGGSGAQGIAVFQNSTQTGRGLAERILESTINIKPTLYKNQGDRATIFVSRDLDFGRVYALRAK